ncbi:SDR family oxidoreductase [Acrocarpospora macrocephala]|uniref:NAD(P)-dependent oxidoreductase n=1 Tax=Acrocarpospora macrocephala TaxID=150177 RepID=A0A5M3WJX5_9ACTN|nr:SDR family oxidoreductase [Acrocarpospora macrocephala]GES06708.1 NAD(P)-dependent oxidoreductase [Acrocarpospora macrocephala]
MGNVLVTGATGYVGGRLVPELIAAGHDVACVVRRPERLRDVPWAGKVRVSAGDVADPEAMRESLRGVEVAYYLVHSMAGGPAFAERDRRAATNFAEAANSAGVRRIVYLGGLTHAREKLSPHMGSRTEVGEIFLAAPTPAVVLRAAMIIGSGSASFEMLRHLTERLPVMTTPRWVHSPTQPIAIRDTLRYLVGWASVPDEVNRAFDIGGPDVLTYGDMMRRYAQVAGLPPRVIIPVPVLTPGLSSLWVGLVTPVPASLARPLVESLRHEAVCAEHDISTYIPDPPDGLIGFDESVRLALRRIKEADVATRWSSASTPGAPSDPLPTDPDWAGGSLYADERTREVAAPPAAVWRVIQGIGGANGWYSLPVAWRLRGLIDRLMGGVGLRRGRRDPDHLRVGDVVDFWRVEEIEPGHLLRLRAEMLLPGLAWLELAAEPGREPGRTLYRQRAIFHPRGLLGHLYWRGISPFHRLIFGRMPGNIARAAECGPRSPPTALETGTSENRHRR